MPRTANYDFDAVVLGKDGLPVALVKVKEGPDADWSEFLSVLRAHPPGWPYLLGYFPVIPAPKELVLPLVFAVDPKHIRVYDRDDKGAVQQLAQLETPQILQRYDRDFSNKRVFQPYLLTLVEAWIRDLAYHWKTAEPPGQRELQETGLLERIKGGTTQRRGE